MGFPAHFIFRSLILSYCLKLYLPGLPYNLLRVSCGDIGSQEIGINEVLAWKAGTQSAFLYGLTGLPARCNLFCWVILSAYFNDQLGFYFILFEFAAKVYGGFMKVYDAAANKSQKRHTVSQGVANTL